MWKWNWNLMYLIGKAEVVVSECLGLSLFFSVSFLIIMDITVHRSVQVHVHEQFWCPSVGFLLWHSQTSFSNKPYKKFNSCICLGFLMVLKQLKILYVCSIAPKECYSPAYYLSQQNRYCNSPQVQQGTNCRKLPDNPVTISELSIFSIWLHIN